MRQLLAFALFVAGCSSSQAPAAPPDCRQLSTADVCTNPADVGDAGFPATAAYACMSTTAGPAHCIAAGTVIVAPYGRMPLWCCP